MTLLNTTDLKKIDNLELLASQVVEGFIIGLHKSPYHGFSVEFAEHNQYNPGESTRNIDWKVYARTDKLFVKKYEEETNLRCQIIIDNSSSMHYPTVSEKSDASINKIRFSVVAAASLMHILQNQRDAFGLNIYDSELRLSTRTKTSTRHYQLMLAYLEKLLAQSQEGRTTSTAEALHLIAERVHKRSLVILFTDMFNAERNNLAELFDALQHLKHRKHELILFHVLDHKTEIDFDFENKPYKFTDIETGQKLKLLPQQFKERYFKQMQKFLEEIKEKCLRYKIDFIETDIHNGVYPVLQSYLIKRSKMYI